ncbi:TPA: hypothetical protein GXZ34_04680 [bacterium]|nr:hypothetical protein [bacterium]
MKKLLLIILFLLVVSLGISTTLAFINYNHNKKIDDTTLLSNIKGHELISNQRLTSDVKYGFFRSNKKGCGWIALYNILKLDGQDVKVENVVLHMDLYGKNAFASLGSNPLSMALYLKLKGYDVKIYLDQEKFDDAASKTDFGIIGMLSTSKKGGHYQAYFRNEDDTLTFTNDFSTSASISDYISGLSYKYYFLLTVDRK